MLLCTMLAGEPPWSPPDDIRARLWPRLPAELPPALARTIRARYTVLDLVNETGILDECVAELFAPGGFWAESAHV